MGEVGGLAVVSRMTHALAHNTNSDRGGRCGPH